MVEQEETGSVPVREAVSTSRWSYDQLKTVLRAAVLDRREATLDELPSSIDFGSFAKEIEKLVVHQNASSDGKEFRRSVGIEIDPPYALVFSPIRKMTDQWGGRVNSIAEFGMETLMKLGGTAVILHSHPSPIPLSPEDLTPLQTLDSTYPLIGVGAAAKDGIPGFIMFTLRTSATERITVEEATSNPQLLVGRANAVTTDTFRRHASLLLTILNIAGPNSNLTQCSKEEIMQIGKVYDTVARAEGERAHLGFYVAPLGTTVARRCDLNKPLLSQIPVAA